MTLPQLNGATRLVPIIGDPIKYVGSPTALTQAFAERDHNGICIPLQVPVESFEVIMAGLAATPNIDGIVVTMPHKQAAFRHCATLAERARLLQVSNVLRRNPDGTWHGDMVDGLAFGKAQTDHGAVVEGARALLVGAGGAGGAIALALLDAGVRELVVSDRDDAHVDALIAALAEPARGRLVAGPPDPRGCDLVCNATPLGMNEGDPLPVDPALLDDSMFLGDVIAGHGITPFIAAGRALGCGTATGDDMIRTNQDLIADFMLGR